MDNVGVAAELERVPSLGGRKDIAQLNAMLVRLRCAW
jgi:hypothetical protein